MKQITDPNDGKLSRIAEKSPDHGFFFYCWRFATSNGNEICVESARSKVEWARSEASKYASEIGVQLTGQSRFQDNS